MYTYRLFLWKVAENVFRTLCLTFSFDLVGNPRDTHPSPVLSFLFYNPMGGKILNYGSFNLDQTFTVPHIVEPGETLSATGFSQRAGGKGELSFTCCCFPHTPHSYQPILGANQSVSLAKVNH